MARASGYDVIAVAGARNHELCTALGARLTFDHADPNIVSAVVHELGGQELAGAYDCIGDWFKAHGSKRHYVASKFYSHLYERVQVIWYEAPRQLDATTLFTRLNVGRIPLTDAELVKANAVEDCRRPTVRKEKVKAHDIDDVAEIEPKSSDRIRRDVGDGDVLNKRAPPMMSGNGRGLLFELFRASNHNRGLLMVRPETKRTIIRRTLRGAVRSRIQRLFGLSFTSGPVSIANREVATGVAEPRSHSEAKAAAATRYPSSGSWRACAARRRRSACAAKS